MDYIYGILNEKVEKNIYTGADTETATVIVDNTTGTISAYAHLDKQMIKEEIQKAVSGLDLNVKDVPIKDKFITSVSQNDGKISVTRDYIQIDSVQGLPQSLEQLDQRINNLNYTQQTTDIPVVVTSVSQTKGLVSASARELTINDIKNLQTELNNKANSTNLLHMLGVSSKQITDGGNQYPIINEVEVIPKQYDMVVYNYGTGYFEFVYFNGKWIKFGDEVSFIKKGNVSYDDIKSVQIPNENIQNIQMEKVTNLNQTIDTLQSNMLENKGDIITVKRTRPQIDFRQVETSHKLIISYDQTT